MPKPEQYSTWYEAPKLQLVRFKFGRFLEEHEDIICTYSLSLLVGSGEFLSLVLKTAQLDLELVKTAVQLGEVRAGVVQLICDKTS